MFVISYFVELAPICDGLPQINLSHYEGHCSKYFCAGESKTVTRTHHSSDVGAWMCLSEHVNLPMSVCEDVCPNTSFLRCRSWRCLSEHINPPMSVREGVCQNTSILTCLCLKVFVRTRQSSHVGAWRCLSEHVNPTISVREDVCQTTSILPCRWWRCLSEHVNHPMSVREGVCPNPMIRFLSLIFYLNI